MENLINRIRSMMSYANRGTIINRLLEYGHSNEALYLAYKAALIMEEKMRVHNNSQVLAKKAKCFTYYSLKGKILRRPRFPECHTSPEKGKMLFLERVLSLCGQKTMYKEVSVSPNTKLESVYL